MPPIVQSNFETIKGFCDKLGKAYKNICVEVTDYRTLKYPGKVIEEHLNKVFMYACK